MMTADIEGEEKVFKKTPNEPLKKVRLRRTKGYKIQAKNTVVKVKRVKNAEKEWWVAKK